MQEIKSDAVCRKIRSEALSQLDRDKDDVIDLIKMKRDHPEYIQFVGEPFQVHLFSVEQLHMITSDEKCVLHFDATGTLPRAPKKEKKRCFYYSGVMRVGPNNRICPILELLLCRHDSNTIGYGLLNFQKILFGK
ncbi:hypothetical protein JTB14_030211 [Gonioctena quinquepunctata]|nr:hypothetical protein JTB14_030211 [Gonioctena quinquepunctata]